MRTYYLTIENEMGIPFEEMRDICSLKNKFTMSELKKDYSDHMDSDLPIPENNGKLLAGLVIGLLVGIPTFAVIFYWIFTLIFK